MAYEMHYTGVGYPSTLEIIAKAKERGFTHYFWASEYGRHAFYNGDTVVVYTTTDDMPEDIKADAEAYGKQI